MRHQRLLQHFLGNGLGLGWTSTLLLVCFWVLWTQQLAQELLLLLLGNKAWVIFVAVGIAKLARCTTGKMSLADEYTCAFR